MNVIVSGVGVVLPGADSAADLLTGTLGEPVDPVARLGRKGLRFLDQATRLSLCAGGDALRAAGVLTEDGLTVATERVAVVVSSNLGNLDTVCKVLAAMDRHTTKGVSPMDGPTLSSNIIASEVAIRYGLRGPNLTVCGGETSGLDAVRWAGTLLRSGRAEVVLVIGVEPDNEDTRRFAGVDRLIDGAVGLVLESAANAELRGAPALAGIGRYLRAADAEAVVAGFGATPGLLLGPDLLPDTDSIDLTATWGAASGALGVLQCAAAVGWFAEGNHGPVHAVAGSGAGLELLGVPG